MGPQGHRGCPPVEGAWYTLEAWPQSPHVTLESRPAGQDLQAPPQLITLGFITLISKCWEGIQKS